MRDKNQLFARDLKADGLVARGILNVFQSKSLGLYDKLIHGIYCFVEQWVDYFEPYQLIVSLQHLSVGSFLLGKSMNAKYDLIDFMKVIVCGTYRNGTVRASPQNVQCSSIFYFCSSSGEKRGSTVLCGTIVQKNKISRRCFHQPGLSPFAKPLPAPI